MQNFNFKKKYGQNFISDKNLLSAIVSDARVSADDEVLEIGAGAGSMTQELSKRAKKVVAYEIDRELEPILRNLNLPNVEFVFADFMKENSKKIAEKFEKKVKIVANLPYYITSPIIFKVLEELDFVESLTVMVQKEVAERVCASCGGREYGVLSATVALFGTAKITRTVGRNMFHPVPNVDSAVLSIQIEKKYDDIDKKAVSEFIKLCFSMRRKTLQNNLSKMYPKELLLSSLSPEILSRRAESFSPNEFIEIYEKLQKFQKNQQKNA